MGIEHGEHAAGGVDRLALPGQRVAKGLGGVGIGRGAHGILEATYS